MSLYAEICLLIKNDKIIKIYIALKIFYYFKNILTKPIFYNQAKLSKNNRTHGDVATYSS